MHTNCAAVVWLANTAVTEYCAVYFEAMCVVRSSHLPTWQLKLRLTSAG